MYKTPSAKEPSESFVFSPNFVNFNKYPSSSKYTVDPTYSKFSSFQRSFQKSESKMKKLIEERDVCLEIKQVMMSTMETCKLQIEEQKRLIETLSQENKSLKGLNQTLMVKYDKLRSMSKKKENGLMKQIEEQQNVRIFF